MNFKYALCILTAIALFSVASVAQKTIANGGNVSENFDAIGTGNISLTDNTTPGLTGFYSFRSAANATPQTFTASAGTSGTSTFYSFGQAANANRALGWVNGNGVTSYLGLRLANNGVNAITSLRIQYAGEQWRDGNGSAETMGFSYQIGGAGTMTSLTAGTFTSVPAFLFTSPNAPGGSNSWNGDLGANRVAFDQTISVNIPAGSEIMLRWSSLGTSAQGDGIGVDDITISAITPTAAGATISGRVVDAYGRAIYMAAVSIQDFNGVSKTFYTNSFGYYRSTEFEVGQSYVIGVSARRYTFSPSSQVINLSNNVEGFNFVASR